MISLLILTCDMPIHIQEVTIFLRKTTEKGLLVYLECSGKKKIAISDRELFQIILQEKRRKGCIFSCN